MEKCTSLEELHANVFDVHGDTLHLPKTLQRLYVFKTFHRFIHANDDAKLLRRLAPLLNGPHLESVTASLYGLPDVSWNLLKSEVACMKAGVKFSGTNVGDRASCTWSRKLYI